jgi:hypothetical protein
MVTSVSAVTITETAATIGGSRLRTGAAQETAPLQAVLASYFISRPVGCGFSPGSAGSHTRGMVTSVAVIGGGIGGLAAAAFLDRAGLRATVYEQACELGEVGAGLIVAPNAARLLRRLPSASALARAGVVLETGWEFRRWADGTILFAQQLGAACARRYGEHTGQCTGAICSSSCAARFPLRRSILVCAAPAWSRTRTG